MQKLNSTQSKVEAIWCNQATELNHSIVMSTILDVACVQDSESNCLKDLAIKSEVNSGENDNVEVIQVEAEVIHFKEEESTSEIENVIITPVGLRSDKEQKTFSVEFTEEMEKVDGDCLVGEIDDRQTIEGEVKLDEQGEIIEADISNNITSDCTIDRNIGYELTENAPPVEEQCVVIAFEDADGSVVSGNEHYLAIQTSDSNIPVSESGDVVIETVETGTVLSYDDQVKINTAGAEETVPIEQTLHSGDPNDSQVVIEGVQVYCIIEDGKETSTTIESSHMDLLKPQVGNLKCQVVVEEALDHDVLEPSEEGSQEGSLSSADHCLTPGRMSPIPGKITCPVCYAPYSIQSFRRHLRGHFNYHPYQCGYCSFTATDQPTITQHTRRKHKGKQTKIVDAKNMDEQKSKYLAVLKEMSKTSQEFKSPASLVCETCGYHFHNKGAFKIHLKCESRRHPVGCHFCNFRCDNVCELNKHIEMKHKKSGKETVGKGRSRKARDLPIEPIAIDPEFEPNLPSGKDTKVHKYTQVVCPVCHGLYSSTSIARHKRRHALIKTYKCPYCDFKCSGKNGVKYHILKSHKSMPVHTTMPKGNQSPPVSSHKSKKHDTKKDKHHCHLCSKSCSSEKKLAHHLKTNHADEKVYKCGHCKFNSKERKKVTVHIKRVHKDKQLSLIVTYSAKNTKNTKNHSTGRGRKSKNGISFMSSSSSDYQDEDSMDYEEKALTICEDPESSASEASEEEPKPRKKPMITCPICQKNFTGSFIRKHMKSVHGGLKAYRCAYCDFKSAEKSEIKTHITTTHLNMPVCILSIGPGSQGPPPAIIQIKDQKKTLKKLTNLKPGACQLCPKKFESNRALAVHYKKKHTQIPMFKCGYCKFSSKDQSFTHHHIQTMHKNKEINIQVQYIANNGKVSTPNKNRTTEDRDYQGIFKRAKTSKNHLQDHQKYTISPPESALQAAETQCGFLNRSVLEKKRMAACKVGQASLAPGTCPFCGRYIAKLNVKRHMKVHFHLYKYQCKYCDYRKIEPYEIKRHIFRRHKGMPAEVLELSQEVLDAQEAEMEEYVKWYLKNNKNLPNNTRLLPPPPPMHSASKSMDDDDDELSDSDERKVEEEVTVETTKDDDDDDEDDEDDEEKVEEEIIMDAKEEDDQDNTIIPIEECSSDMLKKDDTLQTIMYSCRDCDYKDYDKDKVVSHIQEVHNTTPLEIEEIHIQVTTEEHLQVSDEDIQVMAEQMQVVGDGQIHIVNDHVQMPVEDQMQVVMEEQMHMTTEQVQVVTEQHMHIVGDDQMQVVTDEQLQMVSDVHIDRTQQIQVSLEDEQMQISDDSHLQITSDDQEHLTDEQDQIVSIDAVQVSMVDNEQISEDQMHVLTEDQVESVTINPNHLTDDQEVNDDSDQAMNESNVYTEVTENVSLGSAVMVEDIMK